MSKYRIPDESSLTSYLATLSVIKGPSAEYRYGTDKGCPCSFVSVGTPLVRDDAYNEVIWMLNGSPWTVGQVAAYERVLDNAVRLLIDPYL